jgi:hypothetical protein
VGIGVEGDAVGAQFADLLHRAGEARGRLLGQAVDQVGVDRAVAQRAGASHQLAHHLERLLTVHGLLHVGIEVLDAEAQAVEAEAAEVRSRSGVTVRGSTSIETSESGVRRTPRDGAHQPLELVVGEEGRRAAAEVELRHRSAGAEAATTSASSASSASRYGAARSWCCVMILLQAQ